MSSYDAFAPIYDECPSEMTLGIDSSPALLALAGARAEGAGVELREGDMRALTLDEPAGVVSCPDRALLHLATRGEKRRVFEGVEAALRPGGRCAWNAFAFDPRVAAGNDGFAARQGRLWEYVEHAPADNRIDWRKEFAWVARKPA